MRSDSNSIRVLRCSRAHALEVAGVVAGGEGVLLAADGGDHLREPPVRILRRALEHQVFEEMREAGFARRLVGGADPIPDHVGDDRRAVVGDDHDFEAVGEREMRDIGAAGGLAAGSARERARATTARGSNAESFHVHGARLALLVRAACRLGQEVAAHSVLSGAATARSGRSIGRPPAGSSRDDFSFVLVGRRHRAAAGEGV